MKRKRPNPVTVIIAVPVIMAFFAWGGYQVWDLLQHPETWYIDLDHDPRFIIPMFAVLTGATILMLVVTALVDLKNRRNSRRKAEQKKSFDAMTARAEQCIRDRKFKEAEDAIDLARQILRGDN
jgi:TRAP-type C4-dicarboxylate transport system permease small subunit